MSAAEPHGAERDLAAVFAALGDTTRLAIVRKLGGGRQLSISALACDGGLTRQAVTKHLRTLQKAGLVASLRAGRETRYALEAAPLVSAHEHLVRAAAHWDRSLERLRALVEDP